MSLTLPIKIAASINETVPAKVNTEIIIVTHEYERSYILTIWRWVSPVSVTFCKHFTKLHVAHLDVFRSFQQNISSRSQIKSCINKEQSHYVRGIIQDFFPNWVKKNRPLRGLFLNAQLFPTPSLKVCLCFKSAFFKTSAIWFDVCLYDWQ